MKSGVARGHLQIHLSFNRPLASAAGALNRSLLDAYMAAFQEASKLYNLDAKPDLNTAFRIPGILAMGTDEEVGDEVSKAILDLTRQAVGLLNEFREREGAAMAQEMRERCQKICGLVARMEQIREGALPAFHKRLRDKLTDLLHGSNVDPQRLAQEAALLADRSDIAEELVRLRTHASHLNDMISGAGEVGKRLDFLLQEMNRESNTILSKTGGLGDLGLTITDLALAAKSEIDKIREQSLNLE